jgi:hypothetical protein
MKESFSWLSTCSRFQTDECFTISILFFLLLDLGNGYHVCVSITFIYIVWSECSRLLSTHQQFISQCPLLLYDFFSDYSLMVASAFHIADFFSQFRSSWKISGKFKEKIVVNFISDIYIINQSILLRFIKIVPPKDCDYLPRWEPFK